MGQHLAQDAQHDLLLVCGPGEVITGEIAGPCVGQRLSSVELVPSASDVELRHRLVREHRHPSDGLDHVAESVEPDDEDVVGRDAHQVVHCLRHEVGSTDL